MKMQFLESLLSFLVLISISAILIIPAGEIDNSLYLYELQGDIKNVIHLKGGFENLSEGNAAVMEILEETGLCYEMSETEITSMRPSGKSISSAIWVPKTREGNLTGFTKDTIVFGVCND